HGQLCVATWFVLRDYGAFSAVVDPGQRHRTIAKAARGAHIHGHEPFPSFPADHPHVQIAAKREGYRRLHQAAFVFTQRQAPSVSVSFAFADTRCAAACIASIAVNRVPRTSLSYATNASRMVIRRAICFRISAKAFSTSVTRFATHSGSPFNIRSRGYW